MQKIVLVGQPRSGTSMMMRVLEAGGIDCEYGESKGDKEKFRNIYGFFEIKKPTYTKCFKCWNTSYLYEVPKDWKVIFIERDIPSIINSWKNVSDKNDTVLLEKKIKDGRTRFKQILTDGAYEVLRVTYDLMHEEPEKYLNRIKDFVYPTPFNVKKALKMIDKNLYVNRK